MDKASVLTRLEQDKPLFHHIDEEGSRRIALTGVNIAQGEYSWAIGPKVMRWIADRVTKEMVTLETGAGYSTVLFAALAKHHYCCTESEREADKILAYLKRIDVSGENVSFLIGSSDKTLPSLATDTVIDFGYIDGCHGYPFPALDWHYIDKHLRVGGIIGMDNVELRPVREHCDFLEENGTYRLVEAVNDGYFIRFYEKLSNDRREWIDQPYSRAKQDPCDWKLATRIKRKASKWIKPHLF
jgi:hypothetical protein